MCEERSIAPYTLHCGACGEKISTFRKTQVENHTVCRAEDHLGRLNDIL